MTPAPPQDTRHFEAPRPPSPRPQRRHASHTRATASGLGLLCVLLTLLTLLTTHTGCQSEPAPGANQGATPIVLWHAYRAEEEAALMASVEAFNASHPNIRVEAQKIAYQAFADKITNAIPRDNGPDLFIFAHDRIGDWAEADLIEPITIWAPEATLKGYIESTVRALVYKKSLYGLPMTFKSVALFYNTALIPEPPSTEQELVKLALTQTDPKQKRYGLAYTNSSLYFTAAFIHGFGGQTLDIDGSLHLTDPGTVQGMDFVRSLVHTHAVMPEDVDGSVVTNLFNSGRAAMVINGPWFIGEISDKIDWKVTTLPTISSTGRPAAPFFGSEAVMMSRRSAHKRETFEVMAWLSGPEGSKIRLARGKQPVAWAQAWDAVEVDEVQRTFRRQIEHAVFMPNISDMRYVWEPTDQAITRIVKKNADPAATLAEAQARIEAARQ